jgi:hypothetical protein
MAIHSYFAWDYGDPITEELIDEIIRIIKANGRFLAFTIMSRVDEFAYIFMENISLASLLENNSGLPHIAQLTEIYTRVQNKLNS